ncbi:MAG: hypothetical protein ACJ763_09970 [Bdellovibrionia bacterium]
MRLRLFKGLKALLGIAFLFSGIAHSEIQSPPVPTINELSTQIASRLTRVEEFKFIRTEAEKLGVRAYLFGGTAAAYAHYVKWDMQRELGDKRYQPDRFDYDYTNIFRSTQDLDIVIDGNAEQAQTLQNALQQKYPHLQGKKTAWEVRLLNQDMGDKLAILNNPDFMNQHTDSNSTGMIEISKPKPAEPVVRDVRDWNSSEPYFLKDVHDGTLHYYFSPLHKKTKFAKEGRNPPIISVIRYLTKAFQYDLKLRPEDLAQIQKIIDDFYPHLNKDNSYVNYWIEKNGKKLVQNAVNIEHARDTLAELGLSKKLIDFSGDPTKQDSLAWWLSKEPLRTKPIGQGSGKTAKELGLDVVAHETNSDQAVESITRAHTGDPNVFISRNYAAGEAAVYGDGFYTMAGKQGARGTGLTIRFHLDPNARESTDFKLVNHDLVKDFPEGYTYVIVQNKAALKVIPESLNMDPVQYFRLRAEGKLAIDADDGALAKRLERKIRTKLHALPAEQQSELAQTLKHYIDSSEPMKLTTLVQEWPELISSVLIHHEPVETFKGLAEEPEKWLSSAKELNVYPKLKAVIESPNFKLSDQECQDIARILERNAQSKSPNWELLKAWFASPKSPQYSDDLLKILLQRKWDRPKLVLDLLNLPPWKNHPLTQALAGQKVAFQAGRSCVEQIKLRLTLEKIGIAGFSGTVLGTGAYIYQRDTLRSSEEEMLARIKSRMKTAKSLSELLAGVKLPDGERPVYDKAFRELFDQASVGRLLSLPTTTEELRKLADYARAYNRPDSYDSIFDAAYQSNLRKSRTPGEFLSLMHKVHAADLGMDKEAYTADEFVKLHPTSKDVEDFLVTGHYFVPPYAIIRHIISNARNLDELMHPLTLSKEDFDRRAPRQGGNGLVAGSFGVYDMEISAIEKFEIKPKDLKTLANSVYGGDEIHVFFKIALKQAKSRSQVKELVQALDSGLWAPRYRSMRLREAIQQNAEHLKSLGMSEKEAKELLAKTLKLEDADHDRNLGN